MTGNTPLHLAAAEGKVGYALCHPLLRFRHATSGYRQAQISGSHLPTCVAHCSPHICAMLHPAVDK
eukprot:4323596-Pyramimonas_sp.AAC.2